MEHVSRRSILTSASVAAAAAGLAVAAGPLASAGANTAPSAAPLTDQVVARVRNLATGEVDLYIGERAFTVHDNILAHSIAHAAQSHAA